MFPGFISEERYLEGYVGNGKDYGKGGYKKVGNKERIKNKKYGTNKENGWFKEKI